MGAGIRHALVGLCDYLRKERAAIALKARAL
jgi:hypothetical protein